MHDRTATIALLGASAVSAMLLGTASEAHADRVTFENFSDVLVSVVYAEADSTCPDGLRDRAWLALSAHESEEIELNTDGEFYLAAAKVIPIEGAPWESISPVGGEDALHWWSPPEDSSSAGQCSDIRPLDDDPNAGDGVWHSEWNLSNVCPVGGSPCVQVAPSPDTPAQTLVVGVFCCGAPPYPDGGVPDAGNPDKF